MSMAMIRDLYEYHRWANRTLFDFAAALGEGTCASEVGAHFSHSKVTRMFAHLYGADWVWLSRWKGTSPITQPSTAARSPPWSRCSAARRPIPASTPGSSCGPDKRADRGATLMSDRLFDGGTFERRGASTG